MGILGYNRDIMPHTRIFPVMFNITTSYISNNGAKEKSAKHKHVVEFCTIHAIFIEKNNEQLTIEFLQ